jgi:hypothetical protein
LFELPDRFFAPRGAIALRHWHDEWVAYDGDAAKTHLLEEASGAILSELVRSGDGLSLVGLWKRLFPAEPDPDADEGRALEGLVDRLIETGLVHERR